jgi:perosamine synthetase
MWSRKRIDIGWLDILYGIFRVCFPLKTAGLDKLVEKIWPNPEHMFACLSVRSGFDLLLTVLELPKGSEVLVSAITIPDMIRIVEHHGLVAVPVDVDPQLMAPTMEAWQRAVTPNARIILATHLFGCQIPMEPILDLAGRHGLLVIEDCAQAFAGTGYSGHSKSDASMFSFGTIKSCTALGGAVLKIRDLQLLARMRAAQAAYPMQNRRHYGKRLCKYAVLKALSSRIISACFVRMCKGIGIDYDRCVNRAARGFPGESFFAQIRQKPCAPLLAVLKRRLQRFDSHRLERHVAKGQKLARLLCENVLRPGAANAPHNYWVFPVLVNEPEQMIEHLARAGFDATQGQSLCVVPPPANRLKQYANMAEKILANIVFLPFYPELIESESKQMAIEVLKIAGATWSSSITGNADSSNDSTVMSAGPKRFKVH